MPDDFKPDWRSPPGDTIRDLMVRYRLTLGELADELVLNVPNTARLIDGKLMVTDSLALRLSVIFGTSVGFWLKREEQYRDALKSKG